jgi:hypothetical protein
MEKVKMRTSALITYKKVMNYINICNFLLFAELVVSKYATKSDSTRAIVVVPMRTGLFHKMEYTSHATRHAMLKEIIPIETADPGTLLRFDTQDL